MDLPESVRPSLSHLSPTLLVLLALIPLAPLTMELLKVATRADVAGKDSYRSSPLVVGPEGIRASLPGAIPQGRGTR